MKYNRFLKTLNLFFILVCSLTTIANVSNSSESNNYLGLNIMNQVLKLEQGEPKNVIFSPLSAQLALSMLYNGASGESAKVLSEFMGYNSLVDVDKLNNENKTRMQSLIVPPINEVNPSAFRKKPIVLNIANSAFSTNGKQDGRRYDFQTSFISKLRSYYHISQPQSLDFRSDEAAEVVNQWANDNTNGMIPKIIEKEDLQDFLWVLMNATYLEGQWTHNFRKYEAKTLTNSNFTDLNGNNLITDLMVSETSHFRYYKDSDQQIIELPLVGKSNRESGESKVKVYVLLPTDLKSFERLGQETLWNMATWSQLMSKMKYRMGELQMPTFSFDYTLTMKKDSKITKALGLKPLFSQSSRFDNMDREDGLKSQVGLIKQSAKIEWDENGLKAAAVTIIGGLERGIAMPPSPEFRMVVDKPFYFAVYDETTSSFLFLGSVVNPKK